MDIITDTAVWAIETVAKSVLAIGRWTSDTIIWLLDWSSQKVVTGLQIVADLAEWIIANPVKALTNLAIIVVIVMIILMIEVYFYDLIKRRNALYRARVEERGNNFEY
ncbi:MAG: hypothetical protein HXS50_02635 [Theionarchaea archaeon]|nr:hypothetical protein [Theionarchaea archaeon]